MKEPASGREHIFVGIPTMGNECAASMLEFVSAIQELNAYAKSPWKFSYERVNGVSPVEYARNRLVHMFLQSDADRLWFVDADMVPDGTSFDLLRVDADICAGRMHKFDHGNPDKGTGPGVGLCSLKEVKPGIYAPIIPQYGDPLVQDVDAVGTGSMVISRRVLEDPRMYLDQTYMGVDGERRNLDDEKEYTFYAPAIFRMPRKANGQPILGEDLDFCRRAKRCGYSIKTHLGATFGHWKALNIDHAVQMGMEAVRKVLEAQSGAHNPIEVAASKSREDGRADRVGELLRAADDRGPVARRQVVRAAE